MAVAHPISTRAMTVIRLFMDDLKIDSLILYSYSYYPSCSPILLRSTKTLNCSRVSCASLSPVESNSWSSIVLRRQLQLTCLPCNKKISIKKINSPLRKNLLREVIERRGNTVIDINGKDETS
ncbi:hypothetical protein LguiB_032234 [Lonicera macranthoides]